jgi:hypothetical protein
MGPLLAGIELGAPLTDEINARLSELERTTGIHVGVMDRDHALSYVLVAPPNGNCDAFALEAAWGKPDVDDGEQRRFWLDPETGRRAQLDQFRGRCSLIFEPYLSAEHLIDSIPFPAVGHARDRLVRQLGPRAKLDESFHMVSWELPPLGASLATSTRGMASYTGSTIILVSVDAATDQATLQAVIEGLTRRFGEPVTTREHTNLDTIRWSKPRIEMMVSRALPGIASFSLVVRKPR